jgi:hypothetical protein
MSEANWELIVHRLDSIAKMQSDVNSKLDELHEKVTKIETIKHSVDSLKKWKEDVERELPVSDMIAMKEWKGKVDEVVSPTQLKEYITEINNLKTFKTKATMIWVVIQAVVFILLFLDKIFNLF